MTREKNYQRILDKIYIAIMVLYRIIHKFLFTIIIYILHNIESCYESIIGMSTIFHLTKTKQFY